MTDLTGQIGLCMDGDSFIAKAIEWDTYSHSYHVVVAISPTECVSAEPGGVRTRTNDAYGNIHWSRFNLTDDQKAAIIKAAKSKLKLPYNIAVFPIMLLSRLTGIKVPQWVGAWLSKRPNVDCSQVSDDIYTAAGFRLFPGNSELVTPADFEALFRGYGFLDDTVPTHG